MGTSCPAGKQLLALSKEECCSNLMEAILPTGKLGPPGPGWALQHGAGAALRSPSTGGGHGVGCG